MITKSNFLNKFPLIIIILYVALLLDAIQVGASRLSAPKVYIDWTKSTENSINTSNPWKPNDPQLPELYIDSTLKSGLNLVLPKSVYRNLNLDAGYDRIEGLPTIQVDYFLPMKGWSDKSMFFMPRLSLSGSKESFSFGGGFRHLITAESMIGFYAFHDWVRSRRSQSEFLKQAGVGLEFSTLPGRYSDLSFSMNVYLPVNERHSLKDEGSVLVKEILPTGADARINFLLPEIISYLDMRMIAQVHSYRGESTDITGYKAILDVRSRDGMLGANFEKSRDSRFGDGFRVEGTLTLALNWMDLLNGKNPFSAPYKVSNIRFSRNMRDALYEKVTRKHDLPAGKSEYRITLAAQVADNSVIFNGGFPHLPNAWVTVQTSQSPWEDFMDVMTDSTGSFSGRLQLPPGTYRIRAVHKPTGRASKTVTVVVNEKETQY